MSDTVHHQSDGIVNEALPDLLTLVRIILSAFILWSIIVGLLGVAFVLFTLAVVTDVLDGRLARRFGTDTKEGAYLDAIADFALVFMTTSGLVLIGALPFWLLVLEGLMFGQFVLTPRDGGLVYDPFGKQYGTMLMAVIGLTLLFLDPLLVSIFLLVIVGYTIISVAFRVSTLISIGRKDGAFGTPMKGIE